MLQTDNILCCLQFLANEAKEVNLPEVSEFIQVSITQILALGDEHPIDLGNTNSLETLNALRLFVRFYLMSSEQTKQKLHDVINALNKTEQEEYVH